MAHNRRPKTQNERRQNDDSDFVRGKRRQLPSNYDDLPRSGGGNSKPKRKDYR